MAVLLISTSQWFGATGLSSYLLAATIPSLVVGFVAGTVTDRFDRRSIVVISDCIRAATSTALLLGGHDRFTVTLALVGVGSAVGTFSSTANMAIVPSLVSSGETASGFSFLYTGSNLMRVAGLGAGGLLAAHYSAVVFQIDALTFLIAAVLRYQIGESRPGIGKGSIKGRKNNVLGGFLRETRSGISLALRDNRLRVGVIIAIVAQIPGAGMNVLVTPYLVDYLKQPGWWLAIIEGAGVVGLLVMSAYSARVINRIGAAKACVWGLCVAAVCIALLGLLPSVAWLVVLDPAAGAAVALLQTALPTLMAQAAPDEFRGRAQAVTTTMSSCLYLLAVPFVGIAADSAGVRKTFAFVATPAILASVCVLFVLRTKVSPATGDTFAAAAARDITGPDHNQPRATDVNGRTLGDASPQIERSVTPLYDESFVLEPSGITASLESAVQAHHAPMSAGQDASISSDSSASAIARS